MLDIKNVNPKMLIVGVVSSVVLIVMGIGIYLWLKNKKSPITNPYGLVFVQDGVLGMASYHFNSLSDCYISYKSAPDDWRLDDGSKVPVQKPFVRPSFDTSTRTFRGVIEWSPPKTWDGDHSWEYEMVFNKEFDAIVSGQVTGRPNGWILKYTTTVQDDAMQYLQYKPPQS